MLAVHPLLETRGIGHALCGGIAANLYRAELRATVDVDFYIVCAATELVALTRLFEQEGWRVHPAWEQAELLRLEREDLPRVDLLIASTDYEKQAVGRATVVTIDDEEVGVLRPEDLIVFKLVAGRARDFEAVAAIINTLGDNLERDFIAKTLTGLGMEERWTRALAEAELEAQGRG